MKTRKRKLINDDDTTASADPALPVASGSRKRPRKDTGTISTPQEETRLARFKPACPQNIKQRVDRVMTQRFFLIDRKREEGEYKEEFKVLGSTGNVYTVMIDKLPSCNCPDAKKGNHCKHILFIFLKVLSVPMSSGLYYQKALLSTELEDLFKQAPLAPNSLSHPRIKAAYSKAMGHPDEAVDPDAATEEEDEQKQRLPGEEDDCPICYETMYKVDIKKLVFCDVCRNAMHNECFQQWARTASNVTCVWCRAKWTVPQGSAAVAIGGAAGRSSEGYLNFGAEAGLSPVRDTSTYHRPWAYRQRC